MKSRVEVYWDEQITGQEGWYYELIQDGDIVEDSMKVYAKVDADAFTIDQRDDLEKALEDAYLCSVIFWDEK